MLKIFGRVRGGVYTFKILKSADFGRFQKEVVRPTPNNFLFDMTATFC